MLDDPAMARPAEGSRLTLETRAGLLGVRRVSERAFTVDMGRPKLAWDEIPLAEPFPDTRRIELQVGPIDDPVLHSPGVVNMGNPHAVFFVEADPDTFDLGRIGPMLENHPLFPRAGQHLDRPGYEPRDDQAARLGTRRRADARLRHRRLRHRGGGLPAADDRRQAQVVLPGGELSVEWRADDHVLMTGPVALVAEGTLAPDLFSGGAG